MTGIFINAITIIDDKNWMSSKSWQTMISAAPLLDISIIEAIS